MKRLTLSIFCAFVAVMALVYASELTKLNEIAHVSQQQVETLMVDEVPPLPSPYDPDNARIERYAYKQLTQPEKTDYKALLRGALQFDKEIPLTTDGSNITKILYAMRMDYPELFWLDFGGVTSSYTDYKGKSRYTFAHNYAMTKEESATMQQKIDQIAKDFAATIPVKSSDYKKVKLVFDFIVNRVDYTTTTKHSGSIYGALVEKKARCQGYALAAQYLLQKQGIFCTFVTGETTDRGAHGWNIVKIENDYYHMDATWGDPVFSGEQASDSDYFYLCANDADIKLTRSFETIIPYPACTSDKYNYYRQSGAYLEKYDTKVIETLFTDALKAGRSSLSLRFQSAKAMTDAADRLIDRQGIYPILRNASKKSEVKIATDSILYYTDNQSLVLTLTVERKKG